MTTSYKPRKIITYPIAGDLTGGGLFIFGEASAKNMVLMSAGFPDDQEAFVPFASRLAKETDCLVGVTCLPGFDDREDKSWTNHKKSGFTFEDMAQAFREAATALRAESSLSSKPKITGIFHDWGVAPGSMWANRCVEEGAENAPDQLVLFDVLLQPHRSTDPNVLPDVPRTTLYELIITYAYRVILALVFMTQYYISTILASIILVIGMLFLKLFRLSAIGKVDRDVIEARDPPLAIKRLMYMSYPYYYTIKAILGGTLKDVLGDASIPKDLKKTPVLYMYGTEKNIMFHDKASLKILEREHKEKKSKSNAISLEGTGHYLYLQDEDFCFNCVKDFMEQES